MSDLVANRAAQLRMTREEYSQYRARLRADYAKTFDSGEVRQTALAFGLLFPLLDPDALLAFVMCSRMPTDEERADYVTAFMRRRKDGETHPESLRGVLDRLCPEVSS